MNYQLMHERYFSRHDALRKLRACMEEDRYELHPHFWKRLRERKVELFDALRVLKCGIIYAEPEFDSKFGQWRYTVQGKTVDQIELRSEIRFLRKYVELTGEQFGKKLGLTKQGACLPNRKQPIPSRRAD